VEHIKKSGELHPLEILEGPWQKISINIIKLLLKSNKQDVIVFIVDQFTNMIRLKVTMTVASSKDIAKIYQNKI